MSLNKNDRRQVEKQAKDNGYNWNSDRSQMIDRKGGRMAFSESGGTVDVNGTRYNTPCQARKSTKW